MNATLEARPSLESSGFIPEHGFLVALARDVKLAARSRGEVIQALAFFVVVVSLFPLAIGPESALLKRIAPGVVWVAALLSVLLTLPRILANDYADGTLEQLALSVYPLPLIVAGKILAHWLMAGLPLALVSPLLGLQFGLEARELVVLFTSLMLGTPVLSLIGAIGAALTLGVRGGSILLALLVLPLYIPVLIFGAGAVEQAMVGVDVSANLSLLGALLLLGGLAVPLTVAMAVRISLD